MDRVGDSNQSEHEKSERQKKAKLRANANEKYQTSRRRESERSKGRVELPLETIQRVCASISLENQPIISLQKQSRKAKLDTSSVNAPRSQNQVSHFNSSALQIPKHCLKVSKMKNDNSSTVSTSSIAAQKRDLEAQITHIQHQLHFIKREGQYRINGMDGRILKYWPDKRTRSQITVLEKELFALNQARSSLVIIPEEIEVEP